MSRILVSDELVEEVQKYYPELKRLNATDIADWAMRKAVKEIKAKEFWRNPDTFASQYENEAAKGTDR